MFTGIVESQGRVHEIATLGSGSLLTIYPEKDMECKVGDSLSVDGACLTVESCSVSSLSFMVSPETLQRTLASSYAEGRLVNLERPLSVNGKFDGHFVTGHVDCMGRVKSAVRLDAWLELWFEYPPEHDRLIVPKGSIAVNGVSLTVNDDSPGAFSVMVIPNTAKITNLGTLREGVQVNLEFDIVGKYITKALAGYQTERAVQSPAKDFIK